MWRQIKNFAHLVEAVLASTVYGFPASRLKILAITGTDGKTTTASLLYHVLKQAGKNVALISTVAAYIGSEEIDTGFHVTNPSSFALQKLLKKISRSGMEYVVLETTSHGIDQNRNWGIHPEISAITNVTHEHLDYHRTYENYLVTKSKLLLQSAFVILNQDAQASFEKLKNIVTRANIPHDVVSIDELPTKVLRAARRRFGQEHYNLENVAVTLGFCRKLGISEKDMVGGIKTFPGVKGRMEEIPNQKGFKIIVDFAHTPNALLQALTTLQRNKNKGKTSGRLISVFGCAGLRDVSKRPMMGRIAAELADLVVFTAEDPRTEDIWTIINQMKSGVKAGHDKIVSIADRYTAIAFAINQLAKTSDTIVISGKGHERSMNIDGTEYDWSDQEAVKKVLSGKERF